MELYLYGAEIIYGKSLGYEYEILEIYSFKTKNFLKSFFTSLFEEKRNAKKNNEPIKEYIMKLLINSGYGFWGYNRFDKDTIVVSKAKSNAHWSYLIEEKLKAHSIHGDYSFCRVLKDNDCNCNVAIASAITSLARMELHKLLVRISEKNGRIYYMDTDSIITDICISDYPDLQRRYMKNGGSALGELKNEFPSLSDYGIIGDKDRYFTELTVVGCKAYSIRRTLCNSEGITKIIEINKLKGYKRKNSEGESTKLSSQVLLDMSNDKEVVQKQTRIMVNKNDYTREDKCFEIRFDEIDKKFRKIYTKGIVGEDGFVKPLTL